MYQALVDFWFSKEVARYWFKSTVEFDRQLLDKYHDTWVKARDGELDGWRESAVGCLALVIVLDQFPLNMFRGLAQSYSTERQSLDVARYAIDKGFDQDLPVEQRAFIYMPFMHSEDLQDQLLAIQLFDQPGLEGNLRYARHHFAIIERFGRFPHRNEALGRDSSMAEIEYLNSKEGYHG